MKTALMKSTFLSLALLLSLAACSKKTNAPAAYNHVPLATLSLTLTSADPFIVDFKVTASDQDGDALTYTWDFGDGISKQGADKETHTYDINKTYTVKVSVSDGKPPPVTVSASVNTTVTEISID